MPEIKLLRTVLFVPGNKKRMLEKARTLPVDAVILDLEDGVPPGAKLAARTMVRQALESGTYGPDVILRVNGFASGLAEADLQETFVAGIAAVCLPKAETVSDIGRLERLLAAVEGLRGPGPGEVGIFLMVETALGVLNAYAMASAARRVQALCLGGEDLARDLGAVRTKEGLELAHARAQLVLAARAAGKQAIDTVWTDLTDPEGVFNEASHARQLGYSGKLIIHPAQSDPVHNAFAPTAAEIAYARRVLEASTAAELHGDGVISLDGQMVDAPVVARARQVLAQSLTDP